MKYLLYLTLCFLLSSCASTFYFSILDSNTDNTIKADNGDFITANDSVLVAYCFSGEEGPVLVIVHNNGDKPLYVDWQRSSIIIKEKATSYHNNTRHISGTVESYSQEDIFIPRYNYSNSEFSATSRLPEGVSFIPPHSRIEYQAVKLGIPNFESIPNKEYSKATYYKKNNMPADVKLKEFTIHDTPLKFRSYLTLYTDPSQPFTFEHEFFISHLMKSKELTPSNIDTEQIDRGDFFFIEKENSGKDIGSILLGSVIVVGAIALDVATSNNDCCY